MSDGRPQQPDRAPDLEVVVVGKPATKGSVRAFIPRRKDGSLVTKPDGSPMVVKNDDSGAAGKAWGASVAEAVSVQMFERGVQFIRSGAVWVEMVFFRPRNASDFGTGRNAGVLKPSAPAYPAVRPDVDKNVRAILDALKSVAWADDGQVVAAPAFKAFGEPARVELRIWRLAASVAELGGVTESAAVEQGTLLAMDAA